MLRREQCECNPLVTITGKTSMDKGTQRDVNSVNSLNSPTCAGVRVREGFLCFASLPFRRVRMHVAKQNLSRVGH